MPKFATGSTHSATVAFSNSKPAGFDYTASLCMGTNMQEMASRSFHLDAGQSKSIELSVGMPTTSGTYPVYVKVFSGGTQIALYRATEDVIIALQVRVALKNPPGDATLWTIALCDWNASTLIHYVGWESRDYLSMAEEAVFEIPSGLVFPLRVVRLQICKWNASKTALIELYYMQSYQPPSKTTVSVSLKNPPSGANEWGLSLWNGVGENWVTISNIDPSSSSGSGIDTVYNFTIPSGWTWPLRFRIAIGRVDYAAQTGYYLVLRQSVSPGFGASEGWQYVQEYIYSGGDNFYNIATGKFEPAGNYREVFIPQLGNYSYNVTSETLESA